MSTATDLISQSAATPPYDIVRAAYAELQVTDLAASEHFYADLLGMIVTERATDAVYLRGWEERVHHSLVLRRAPVPAAARLGFLVRREEDLDLLAHRLASQGLPLAWIDARGPRSAPAPRGLLDRRAGRRAARVRPAGRRRPCERHRARPRPTWGLQRLLRLPARSRRPPHRALRV